MRITTAGSQLPWCHKCEHILICGATIIFVFLLALTSAVMSALWWFALSDWAVARRFGRAAKSFILGLSTVHDVDHVLSGAVHTRLNWVGPSADSDFTAEYVQQEVRRRGENRVPCDLLVDVGGAVARLKRGNLKGRVTRQW